MIIYNYLLLVLLCLGINGKKKGCPPPETIPHCECYEGKSHITCTGILNVWDLKALANDITDYEIHRLRIEHSFVMYLPKELFVNLNLVEFEMLNSEVLGLESDDGSEMFKGVENSLRSLYFADMIGMNSWRWTALSSLKSLEILILRNCGLTRIGKDFASISPETLNTVYLHRNKIEYIHPNAFSNHRELTDWRVDGNLIVDLSRDMLPKPALLLKTISLGENKIQTVPGDFFTEMPSLRYVYLPRNQIQFLSHELFQPISQQTVAFDITENEIFCCDSFKFVTELNIEIRGACKYPQILQGKEINTLTNSDLDHGFC